MTDMGYLCVICKLVHINCHKNRFDHKHKSHWTDVISIQQLINAFYLERKMHMHRTAAPFHEDRESTNTTSHRLSLDERRTNIINYSFIYYYHHQLASLFRTHITSANSCITTNNYYLINEMPQLSRCSPCANYLFQMHSIVLTTILDSQLLLRCRSFSLIEITKHSREQIKCLLLLINAFQMRVPFDGASVNESEWLLLRF